MLIGREKSIGVVVPTYQAENHLQKMLPYLVDSPLQPRVLLVDSSSTDQTVETAERFGVETQVIPRRLFNHGATREWARRAIATDIVVMMTQDAYPVCPDMLERLVTPLLCGDASVSYARQIPHEGADIFEAFPRYFNYPDESNIRGINDLSTYGVYTFFCSDSCSAYVNSALDEIGGFEPILTNEDYFAVAKLLKNGHKIAYVAEAQVRHSHSYNLLQEFRRYFDTGYVRGENPWVTEIAGHAEGRGKDFFLSLIKELRDERPSLIPYAVLNTLVKWLGFRVGCLSLNAPLRFKKLLSSQNYYWDSIYCDRIKGKRW